MWQDNYLTVTQSFGGLGYEAEARRILRGGGVLFFQETPANGDARWIIHPPAYSTLIASLQSITTHWEDTLIWLQIVVNSLAAVVVLLITAELFAFPVALLSGLLVALSPHFAYYALIRSPDSLAVFPLLLAIYCLVKARRVSNNVRPANSTPTKTASVADNSDTTATAPADLVPQPNITPKRHNLAAKLLNNHYFNSSFYYIALAGLMIGGSCWLRPNAMLLSPLFALLLIVWLPSINLTNRILAATLLMAVTGITIFPITLRNWLIYREFIPISIGVGVNLLEGMADYDVENRWNLPGRDEEVAVYDAKLHQRPDYARNMWTPNGIARDRERVRQAQQLIRQQPAWFATVVAQRAAFMLRSNGGKGSYRWPQNTALVPIIAATPTVGAIRNPQPTTMSILPLSFQPSDPTVQLTTLAIAPANNPTPLATKTATLAPNADATVAKDATTTQNIASATLSVVANVAPYSPLVESANINLEPYHNYLLTLELTPFQGTLGIKVVAGKQELANQIVTAMPITDPVLKTNIPPKTKKTQKAEKINQIGTADETNQVNPAVDEINNEANTTNQLQAVKKLPEVTEQVLPGVQKRAHGETGLPTKQIVQLYLASDKHQQCRILITQDSTTATQFTISNLTRVKLTPTAGEWSRYCRPVLRALQKNIFITTYLLALIALGISALTLTKQWAIAGLLLAIPGYFLTAQAILHTEYRYILAIHYFLLILAAVGVYSLANLLILLVYQARPKAI
jgi:hypothetical protein